MKCEFGFTPNIECDECFGTGIGAEDGNDGPNTPCYSCMADAVHNGEVKSYYEEPGQVIRVQREHALVELLPTQPHYYMLSNGDWFARYGIVDCTGLLVFTHTDQVQQFLLAVPHGEGEIAYLNGCALAQFQPLRVPAEDLLTILQKHGGHICVLYERGVIVATITEDADKVVAVEETLKALQESANG